MRTFLGALAAALLGFGLAACGGGGGAAALSTALTGSSLSRESSTAAPATTEAAVATLTETRAGATVTETQSQVVTAAPPVTTPAATTPAATATASESTGTPGWVWALVGVGIALVIGVVVWLLRRGKAGSVTPAERQRRMVTAVSSWTSQGWTLESESDDSAMLARNGERIRVWVDARGNVSSSALATSQGTSS